MGVDHEYAPRFADSSSPCEDDPTTTEGRSIAWVGVGMDEPCD